MPLDKSGHCPFKGSHWPPQWDKESITPKRFDSILQKDQQKDLFEYFYEHESAKTAQNSQPAYRFPLNQLKDYLGADITNLRRTVLKSEGYKEFAAERRRLQAPPPPPEMSLLTSARIAACLAAEPPEGDDFAAVAHTQDTEEKARATADKVVRKADRESMGISFSEGLPNNEGKFIDGAAKKKQYSLDFDKDPHRAMVCNMQRLIEVAANKEVGVMGGFTSEQKEIFSMLVKEEERKDEIRGKCRRKDARAPYTARAALGLILLFSSILW